MDKRVCIWSLKWHITFEGLPSVWALAALKLNIYSSAAVLFVSPIVARQPKLRQTHVSRSFYVMYKFNYGSDVQSITGQDVELKEFESYEALYEYAVVRLSSDHDCVYVAFFDGVQSFDSDEFPHAFIARHYSHLFRFLKTPVFQLPVLGLIVNVFECTSYDDALKYLEGYFETSSKMYDNEN